MQTTMTTTTRIETLLRDQDSVRRIARALASDRHDADDVEQDAWVQALEHPPRDRGRSRAWLATVTRRAWTRRVRTENRRERRERDAGQSARASADSTDEVVARLELKRDIFAAVLKLEEPFRTAISMRYLDAKAPRAIASELSLPIATVRSRLHRGLEKLRTRLDTRYGDRERWRAALLALPGIAKPEALLPLLSGVVLVNMKLVSKLALVALAVLVGFFVWDSMQTAGPLADAALGDRVEDVAVDDVSSEDNEEAVASIGERVAEIGEGGDPGVKAEAPTGMPVRGLVVTSAEQALAGVTIKATLDGAALAIESRSDARGVFQFENVPQGAILATDDARFATVLACQLPKRASRDPFDAIVVAETSREVEAVVRDERGALVVGAHANISYPIYECRIAQRLDETRAQYLMERSADDGRISFAKVARMPGTKLNITKDGFEPWSCPVDVPSAGVIFVTLRDAKAGEGSIVGRIVDASFRPIRGAFVACGKKVVRTRDNGDFVLDQPDSKARVLKVLAPGQLPEERRRSGEAWPKHMVIRMARPTLQMRGTVVDEEGQALQGVRVWIKVPSGFPRFGQELVAIEPLLQGAPTGAERSALLRERAGSDPKRLRELRDATPSVTWNWVETDASGSFTIRGLLDKDYVLRALDPKSLTAADSPARRAGASDCKIVLPTKAVVDVRGRVVDFAGSPIADAEVRVYVKGGELATKRSVTWRSMDGPSTRTDAEGRFVLPRVPQKVTLLVSNPYIMRTMFREIAPEVTIRVERRYHVRVEYANQDDDLKCYVQVEDADGKKVDLTVLRANSSMSTSHMEIEGGKTPTFIVGGSAKTLVLVRGNKVLRRVPIQLEVGKVARMRL